MQRYFNTVTTRSGDVISGALVTVKDADGNVATIYSDTDGATEQDNPISTDSNGFFGFYAADGTYSLTITGSRMRPITITGIMLGAVDTDLSESGGSALIGFIQSGTGAVARTAQAKNRDTVSVKDYGATGDGTTDDTTAVHAAIDYAKSVGASVWFPAGTYRVTSGYTQSTAKKDIFLRGAGRLHEAANTAATVILLDSSDANSFFLKLTANGALSIEGLNFKSNQSVTDRPFFKFETLHLLTVRDVTFMSVERPFVFGSACYLQNASLRDVSFLNSGTLHSENTTLAGTLLKLDNVNHEGSVPSAISEKIVCNLYGWRQVTFTNFLLEGGPLPATGWTILKIGNPYDGFNYRPTFMIGDNYHSEWSGATRPDYQILQVGGTVEWNYLSGLHDVDEPYRITDGGKAIVRNSAFTVTNTESPSDYFSLEDATCCVEIQDSVTRKLDLAVAGFLYKNTQLASASDASHIVLSNSKAEEYYRWDGGYFLAGPATSQYIDTGNAATPSTDATYKRKYVLTPSGTGSMNQNIVLPVVAAAGSQITVMAKCKLPTFASGLWAALDLSADSQNPIDYRSTTDSGQVIQARATLRTTNAITSLTITFGNGTTPGATGGTTFELYDLAVFVGEDVPRQLQRGFSKNIVTANSAAPTAGTWNQGDKVWNSAPSAGGAPGWVCTSGGTPGTWKAMASVAA